jgi:hypothetical protein
MSSNLRIGLLYFWVVVPPVALAVPVGHEQCIKASDYKGCIEVFSDTIKNQAQQGEQRIKINIDTQVTADGNECPSEFAYAGGGYCRRVICESAGLFGLGHHPDLAGKGLSCHKGIGQMRWGEWDKERVRASVNPRCPDFPLAIGYQSTCFMASSEAFNVMKSGNYDLAIDRLEKSFLMNRSDWVVANNYGVTLIELNRAQSAVEPLRASLAIKDHPKIRMNLAIALFLSDPESGEVVSMALQALKQEPRFANETFLINENFGPRSRAAVKALVTKVKN